MNDSVVCCSVGPLFMAVADSLTAQINFEFETVFVSASNKNNYMGTSLCVRQVYT
jgi:hypothetical protein